ncbi:c-type cytochrome [Paenibacillus sp. y28]|uniref:c-type cytochrome n=1 Tax=Paenibacillus sp. y28 TaxID=3129110 RepID=UPI0030176CB6
MAHGNNQNEKVVYVGDSRVKKRENKLLPMDYSAYPGKSEAFIPNFLLKEWMVGAIVLVGYMVLVIQEPAPLGYPADPLTAGFIPMPDWYFLFMYQLLKYPYASGDYKVFGTVIMPALMFGALLLAPFLDTGKERRFYRRPIASSLMIVTLLAVSYLTVVSWSHYQHELKAKGIVPEHLKREEELKEAKLAGKEPASTKKTELAIVDKDNAANTNIYQKSTCVSCHASDLKGGPAAPSLRGVGDKHSKEEILNIIKNGQGNMPAMYDANIAKGLTAADIDAMADWLSKQKKE